MRVRSSLSVLGTVILLVARTANSAHLTILNLKEKLIVLRTRIAVFQFAGGGVRRGAVC